MTKPTAMMAPAPMFHGSGRSGVERPTIGITFGWAGRGGSSPAACAKHQGRGSRRTPCPDDPADSMRKGNCGPPSCPQRLIAAVRLRRINRPAASPDGPGKGRQGRINPPANGATPSRLVVVRHQGHYRVWTRCVRWLLPLPERPIQAPLACGRRVQPDQRPDQGRQPAPAPLDQRAVPVGRPHLALRATSESVRHLIAPARGASPNLQHCCNRRKKRPHPREVKECGRFRSPVVRRALRFLALGESAPAQPEYIARILHV
jgi:hypothetical protein